MVAARPGLWDAAPAGQVDADGPGADTAPVRHGSAATACVSRPRTWNGTSRSNKT